MDETQVTTVAAEQPIAPLYIVYVGTMVNGLILQGYRMALIYPGEVLQVRDTVDPTSGRIKSGFEYDAAYKLVKRGDFIWVDAAGNPVEEPTPTDLEKEKATKSGAYSPLSHNNVYPTHHFIDREYLGPDDVRPIEEPEPDPEPNPVAITGLTINTPDGMSPTRRDTVGPVLPAQGVRAVARRMQEERNAAEQGETSDPEPDPKATPLSDATPDTPVPAKAA